MKYFVKDLLPNLFLWGLILSAMQIIFVCLFFLTLLKMVPNAGPMNGNQNRTTMMSGFSFFKRLPIFIQLNGLMELITGFIFRLAGAGSSVYCVFPGKRKEGYCKEKE